MDITSGALTADLVVWAFLSPVAGYVALALLAKVISPRMIFPRPASSYRPGPEHFRLRGDDGVEFMARHWPNGNATYTLLWFHGNAEDLGTIAERVELWRDRGFSVLAVDYRGYGGSDGSPDEANIYADARAALRWLNGEKQVPLDRVVIKGYSLGSGPAVELAATERVAGLILFAPFVSAYRVMTHWPLFPGDKFRNLDKIANVRCPVLVLHGTADLTIPVWHGRRLFKAVTSRRKCLWVPGAGHGDLPDIVAERHWEVVSEFADSLAAAGD